MTFFTWIQRNSPQDLNRYVSKGRNGADTSVGTQGIISSMISLPFEAPSGIPITSLDIRHSSPTAVPSLATTLASVPPDNQRMVCCFPFFSSLLNIVQNDIKETLYFISFRVII